MSSLLSGLAFLNEHKNIGSQLIKGDCTFSFFVVVTYVIIYMKKLLDSDWLRAVQFKCNTSAKSVTPVQKV